ncbi:hypothetical protein [Vibrio coralliilyticus]|uniref:hypothetical protein n=1 Tax=Vibrio coralliilyticus TaxID=190893 RepID=UPI00148B4D3F|nr:hypothetical protein [Vibrio coralliilyticus]WFB48022.1 hypothetical protein P6988_02005 [Vibrio coralliilyticus]
MRANNEHKYFFDGKGWISWPIIIFSSIKLLFLSVFSSGYQLYLFFPFTEWFSQNGGNPWNAIEQGLITADFPYSSVMLYILTPFNYLINVIDSNSFILNNLIYSLPLFFADLTILICLVKLAQHNKTQVAYIYFFSPVLLFSTYIHNQLDTIPIALLMVSIYFLDLRKYKRSSLFFGLAMSAKLNVFLALPLIFIYLFKHRELRGSFIYVAVAVLVFLLSSVPYIFSDSYIFNVILNSKQKTLFDSSLLIGDVELYLPIFFSFVLYAYFFSFNKVNRDLLIAFVSLLFIANIFFVVPSPGWYVWLLPFVTLTIVKNAKKIYEGYMALLGLNILYILYFTLSYQYDNVPIIILGQEYQLLYLEDKTLNNLIFTLLDSCIICTGLYVYKISVKSNNLYRRKTPFTIGVGGDSGTGKSTLKLLMADLFKENLLQIEGDGDHRWERGSENWDSHTHLNPKANWLHRQSENLVELKNWREAQRVDYDHATGTFTEQYSIKPKEFILISGLHPFYLPISRKSLDLKVYMEPKEELRRYWKIQRDMAHRGYTLERIVNQIESRMSDARKYIYPQKDFSDLVISFFPQNEIDDFTKVLELNIGLRVQFEASISLEHILADLEVEHSWDYAEDLNSQIVELYASPENVDFYEVANKHIPNIDELIYEAKFDSGYNGFIQLVTLLSISQKMKGN